MGGANRVAQRLEDATAQTIGNVRSIRAGGAALAEVAAGRNAARVVDSGGLVHLLGARGGQAVEDLQETLTRRGTRGAVLDHANNLVVGTRVDIVAGVRTSMILHQTRVGDGAKGRGNADTALALLHDGGQDEAGINTRRLSNAQDGSLHVGSLGGRVVGLAKLRAGAGNQVLVDAPDGVKAGPGAVRRPPGTS